MAQFSATLRNSAQFVWDASSLYRYASVFFARYQELKDGQKLLAKIERGEALIQKRHEQQRVLAKKVSQTKSPWVPSHVT